ncbi:MAG: fibrobacter succinogenes major paralogous domain-containing protein [Fibrobacteraceae bacterium]|nr:fibrobacter succinogenes major paralogous domain-containing protein [Fibrobacteraceae bacterium]
MTDTRDGQTYKTVTIGTQTWMAENLNYAYKGVDFDNGYCTDDSTSWCYNSEKSNCDTYGRLYTWSAAMDSAGKEDPANKVPNYKYDDDEDIQGFGCGYGIQCTPNIPHRGICPEGWHVPTNEEYDTLYTTIGGGFKAGTYLKSTDKWSNYANRQGIDLYGFSVLPAGGRGYNGKFVNQGSITQFWSASVGNYDNAYTQYFYYYDAIADQYFDKYLGYSLRCIQD